MTRQPHLDLSRRERQIIDILYANGPGHGRRGAGAAARSAELLGRPGDAADPRGQGPRAPQQDGPRYLYVPTLARDNAKRSAMRHMLQTFFDGSAEQAISALLDDSSARLSGDELDRLARLIDQARRNGA